MTGRNRLRRAAESVLRFALRFAPAHLRDWGEAMFAELEHVEGSWAAFFWSCGSAAVLFRHALLSLIIPSRNRPSVVPSAGFFSKEDSMRKTSIAAILASSVVFLVFLFAPSFRQAMNIARAGWVEAIRGDDYSDSLWHSELDSLARQAEKQHDANTLAFVATSPYETADESARLAEQAVKIEPQLMWSLAYVGSAHPTLPQVLDWCARLEQSDPGNAVPYLLLALRRSQLAPSGNSFADWQKNVEADPQWEAAMGEAFGATKIDDHLVDALALYRDVARRHPDLDPTLVTARSASLWPLYSPMNTRTYAHMLVQEGKAAEDKGDFAFAMKKYDEVVRFSRMIFSKGQSSPNLIAFYFAEGLQHDVYEHLRDMSKKQGNLQAAALYDDLVGEWRGLNGLGLAEQSREWWALTSWTAQVVQASAFFVFLFGALLVIFLAVLAVRFWFFRSDSRKSFPIASGAAALSAVGLLISTVSLYISYRPYVDAFNRFLANPGSSWEDTWRLFLTLGGLPFGLDVLQLRILAWYGVIAAGVLVIAVVITRHFLKPRPKPTPAAAP